MNTTNEPREEAPAENSAMPSSRFVYYPGVSSLQQIASHRVARSILYTYISTHSNPNQIRPKKFYEDAVVKRFGISENYTEECLKIAESLKTPASIEKLLISALDSVCVQTMLLIVYFEHEVLSRYMDEYWIKHYDLKWFAWCGNGAADHAKTASNMLSDPASGLSLEQKFAIMSTFCMEEEVKKFPWQSLSDSFINGVHFYNDPLIYYWLCYLKNEMNEIPLENLNSIEELMFQACEYYAYGPVEYFWNRIANDGQVSAIESYCNNIFLISLFSTMSLQHQHRVLKKIPHVILLNFWLTARSHESAWWVWNSCKHFMSLDQFAQVVYKALQRAASSEDELLFLSEIWNSASDEQRNHVIDTKADEIVAPFLRPNDCLPKAAYKFLHSFLSKKSPDYRKQMIQQNADKFGINSEDPNSLNEIIELCLPDVADQLEYKKSAFQSEAMRKALDRLFNAGKIENFIWKLKYFPRDTEDALQFVKTQLLESENVKKARYLIIKDGKWEIFSQFVDELFAPDVESAWNFKEEFAKSCVQVCRLHNQKKDEPRSVADEIIDILTDW